MGKCRHFSEKSQKPKGNGAKKYQYLPRYMEFSSLLEKKMSSKTKDSLHLLFFLVKRHFDSDEKRTLVQIFLQDK